jgi:hypothetical protein
MTYRTCTGCVFGEAFCNVRENVKAQVKGLGVTSLKWTCKWKRLAFRPGDAVLVETLAFDPEGDEEFYVRTYPGIAIQNKGSKLICFIEPGASEHGDENLYPFEPKGSGEGFVKVPLKRVSKRDGVRETVCHYCRKITRLQGHEEHCPTQPNPYYGYITPMKGAEV